MSLPVTISSSSFPDRNYFCGPFKSSGENFYVVLPETTGSTPEVYKATDPTSSFTAQDTANNPTAVPRAMWAYQVSDVLHIVTQEENAAAGDVHYHTFNMATDAWVIKDELIETPAQAPSFGAEAVSIALRSDGDVIVLYSGDTDAIMSTAYNRCDYARREAAVWTVGVNVGGQGLEAHHVAGVVVLGASDRMHFFCSNYSTNGVLHRSLSSANALDTLATVDATASSIPTHHCGHGISYVSGSDTVVKVPYLDSTAKVSSARINVSGANPTIAVDAEISENDVDTINNSPTVCFAVDATTAYLLYSHDTDLDLYSDSQPDGGSFGTDIEVLDAVTINRISCNVYDRSGTKLAYVYDDGGTIKYNEVDLAPSVPLQMVARSFRLPNIHVGPAVLRFLARSSAVLNPTTGGGAQLQQALAASLSFTGAVSKRAGVPQAGTLSFTGSAIKLTGRGLAATLSLIGALPKQSIRALAGTLTFIGTTAKLTNKALSGALSFLGSVVGSHLVLMVLTATLSFVGAVAKQTSKPLTAVISFLGSLAKLSQRAWAGTLAFGGSLSRQTQRALAGALAFVGGLTFIRFITMLLTATLSFAGSVAKRTARPFTAAMSFLGAVTKGTQRAMAGTVSFIGSPLKQTQRAVAGTLSFVGALTGKTIFTKALTAVLAFVGSTAKLTSKSHAATLSFTGAVAKQISRTVAGTLTFVGTTTRVMTRSLAGSLSFLPVLTRQTGKALSGVLFFSGAISRFIAHVLSGTLSFIGAMTKLTSRNVAGSLTFIGAVVKLTARSVVGTLSFIGAVLGDKIAAAVAGAIIGAVRIANQRVGPMVMRVRFRKPQSWPGVPVGELFIASLTAALSFIGDMTKQAGKATTGTLSFVGTISKVINRRLAGALTFVGAVTRQMQRALSATVSFVGGLVVSRRFALTMTATLDFAGSLARRTAKTLPATLSFLGAMLKRTTRALAGTLSFIGVRTASRLYTRALAATLSFVGSLRKLTQRPVTGTLDLAGGLTRRTRKALAGALSFAGTLVGVLNAVLVNFIRFILGFGRQPTLLNITGSVPMLQAIACSAPGLVGCTARQAQLMTVAGRMPGFTAVLGSH